MVYIYAYSCRLKFRYIKNNRHYFDEVLHCAAAVDYRPSTIKTIKCVCVCNSLTETSVCLCVRVHVTCMDMQCLDRAGVHCTVDVVRVCVCVCLDFVVVLLLMILKCAYDYH